jgi:LytS/YehU family sensor histidine kinase
MRRLARAALVMTLLCTAIALLLITFDGRGWRRGPFVYSFAIGFSCWACTDGLRLLLGTLLQGWRLHRGLPPRVTRLFDGWRTMGPLVVLGTLAGLPLGVWLADSAYGVHSPSLLNWESAGTRITLLVTVLGAGFTLFATTTLERLSAARMNEQAAQLAASQAELKLLQSQLEPHMLFNTLANLRVLIGLDAGRAQAMLDHLINFLRATLAASRAEAHPLSAEFARVAEYLALMGYRMGPRLSSVLELPAELRERPVPPLILQPLVENAIRHGIEPQPGPGRIVVSARREGARLLLSVRDTGAGLQPSAGSRSPAQAGGGFGLVQVRQRLAALHGPAARLVLEPAADADGGTLATLELPWTVA